MSANATRCLCISAFNAFSKKHHMLSYCSHGEIEIMYCDGCNNNIKYVCNSCNCSYKQIREFKHVECLTKNELRCNNPSPSHVFLFGTGECR